MVLVVYAYLSLFFPLLPLLPLPRQILLTNIIEFIGMICAAPARIMGVVISSTAGHEFSRPRSANDTGTSTSTDTAICFCAKCLTG